MCWGGVGVGGGECVSIFSRVGASAQEKMTRGAAAHVLGKCASEHAKFRGRRMRGLAGFRRTLYAGGFTGFQALVILLLSFCNDSFVVVVVVVRITPRRFSRGRQ